jgi:DNA-directed RNA polymerase specialized sigma24 family protein
MDDSQGGGARGSAAEELILRTIAAQADSLLRTARRHSICVDDAQDAYQRALEIFMGHAQRLDPARAAGWLHVVVKREAQAIRRSRHKLLMSNAVDLDDHEADGLPTPEERLLSFDMVSRSAEALKRLKPHELRALWLRAQGHSYSDIGAITGWSYTKVNRCLTEGRRSFLERYEGIESGEECRRWLPVLSAMADGEATPEQVLELRPHLRNCPGCRATLKALQDSSKPLAAVLPVALVAVDAGAGEYVSGLLVRLYEGIAGGLHERAVNSFTKTQALVEASAAGKVAAVAASAAAVAGGGYASVERMIQRPQGARPATAKAHVRHGSSTRKASAAVRSPTLATPAVAQASAAASAPRRDDLGGSPRHSAWAPEFEPGPQVRFARAPSVYAAQARVEGSPQARAERSAHARADRAAQAWEDRSAQDREDRSAQDRAERSAQDRPERSAQAPADSSPSSRPRRPNDAPALASRALTAEFAP